MNKPPFRTGHGFDLHVFSDNRELILGGVKIPYERGLLGHSDADCVIHALADSLLGAVALPTLVIFSRITTLQTKIWIHQNPQKSSIRNSTTWLSLLQCRYYYYCTKAKTC